MRTRLVYLGIILALTIMLAVSSMLLANAPQTTIILNFVDPGTPPPPVFDVKGQLLAV